jgi:hypothetical protein
MTGHVGLFDCQSIAALTESDASMRAREMSELWLPGPVVTSKLVDKNDDTSGPTSS